MSGLVLALVMGGCSASEKAAAAARADAARPAVAVDVAMAANEDFEGRIEVVGTLDPKREADVKSEYTGTVAEVLVTEWVPVSAGEPLARLDTREAEATLAGARAAVKQAEVAETRARREAERAEKLKSVGLMTQQGLDDAHSAVDAAAAATGATRAQLEYAITRLEKAVIRAPFAGVLAFRGVNAGDRVESMGGPTLFRVVDPRVLDLVVTVPSSRIADVRVGQRLEFETDAFPGKVFSGTVSYLNPTVDSADRALKVTATVPNPGGELRGGMFVKGKIITGSRPGVLAIPREALVGWDAGKGSADVFVVQEGLARRRTVTTGAVSGGLVEVTSGVAAGDTVVTRGGFNLRDGDPVTVAASSTGTAAGA